MDPRDKRDGPAKDNMGMDFIPVYQEQKNGSPGTVTISPEIQQNLGVRLAKVEKLPIHQQIETVVKARIFTTKRKLAAKYKVDT
jgi:Cu(I)/Ag(I) efflux system membrane fusion protein